MSNLTTAMAIDAVVDADAAAGGATHPEAILAMKFALMKRFGVPRAIVETVLLPRTLSRRYKRIRRVGEELAKTAEFARFVSRLAALVADEVRAGGVRMQ